MTHDFAGRVALVTGGTAGIGKATCLAYAKAGAKVAVNGTNAERGRQAVREIKALGGDAIFVRADVSKARDVEAMVAKTVEAYGRLDFAFNNAAIEGEGPITHEYPEEVWDRTIAVNLKGYFNWCKAIAQPMLDQGGGRIVNVSSAAANSGGSAYGVSRFAYATAKAGILGLTRALAKELAPTIHVNAVCPGPVETDLTRAKFATQTDRLKQAIPLGRIGTPEDIAEVILFLATASPMFLTGEIIDADGGANVN